MFCGRPQRYLRRYRFSKAIELLRTTEAKICDIANRCRR
jgi:transcriptional regulator GlxA family with amidase domain